MLLPSQVIALRQWVLDAIADSDLTDLTAVVWANEDHPDRVSPYALLAYTGSDDQGADDPSRLDDAGDFETRTDYATSLSITFVAETDDQAPTLDQRASAYMREANARKRAFVADPLRLANIWIQNATLIPNVPRVAGGSQWETRAALDLLIGHAILVTETPGPGQLVEAEIDGTTTPSTPSQTLTVPS